MFSLTIVMRLSCNLPRNPLLSIMPLCCFASTLQMSKKPPLRFLQRKDRNISALDRAVARVLTGAITIEQVNGHHVSKSSVKKCMTRLKIGLATPGRKPTLPRSVEEAIVTYVDGHTNAGMARYRDEVWDKAKQLAREAKVDQTDKVQKRAEVEQRKKEREDKREQRKKDEEEKKKKQEERKHAAMSNFAFACCAVHPSPEARP